MRFTVAPGTVAALQDRGDNRAYWTYEGDLGQMGLMLEFLRSRGLPVVKRDVYPGFPENDEAHYKEGLRLIYEARIEGWWNQHAALLRYGICTEDAYKAALETYIEANRSPRE